MLTLVCGRCGCLSVSGVCFVATTAGRALPPGGRPISVASGVTPPECEPPASSSKPALPWVHFFFITCTFEEGVSAPGLINTSQGQGFQHLGQAFFAGVGLKTAEPSGSEEL